MTTFLLLMLACLFSPSTYPDPSNFKLVVDPEKATYSLAERNIQVLLLYDGKPIEGTWGKIEAVSEYGDYAPVIDDDVGDDVRRYPATDTIFYSPKYQTGVSFYGEKGLLEVTACSTLNPAVTTEVDDKLVKFKTSEKKCSFTLICHLNTERSKNVTYTASLRLIARDEIYYFPPFLPVYLKTEETCPLTVDKFINPMDCMVNEMKLNSPDSALATCELKRSNITCGSNKTLEQTVNIIAIESISVELVNNVKNFIIGEEAPPILVRGYDDIYEISPEFIFCTGLPFKSPHLLIQNVRTEGEKEVVCYAVGYGIRGSNRKFRLGFYCEYLRHMCENV
ncbi:hypothetical protein SprV_0100000500 [Sparganum proliferum]